MQWMKVKEGYISSTDNYIIILLIAIHLNAALNYIIFILTIYIHNLIVYNVIVGDTNDIKI